MIERGLQILAPHYCCGCGKMGSLLCDHCKYDIIHEPFMGCLVCGRPNSHGICQHHPSPIQRAFIVGARTGALEALIDRFKFSHTKMAAVPLAALLDERLPMLPKGSVLVPIPTIRPHVRQRGYDQVELMARQLAALRGLPLLHPLLRATKAVQHEVDRTTRHEQAIHAFTLDPRVNVQGKTIVLIDDIITTGATLSAAAALLSKAGATVWVAAVAYQPMEK